ncbi:MAG: DsbA family protein [Cyanobacteriota bacterium]
MIKKSILLLLLLTSCSIQTNTNLNNNKNKEDSSKTQDIKKDAIKPFIDDTYTFRGNINAKNVVIEFVDFKCGFCAKSKPIVDKLFDKYPNQIKLVYKHYPFINDVSYELAYLFEKIALTDKNKAIEFNNYVFENQDNIKTIENVKEIENKFLSKPVSEKELENIKARIKKDKEEADLFGISGTPMFIINDKNTIKGFLPEKEFLDTFNSFLS